MTVVAIIIEIKQLIFHAGRVHISHAAGARATNNILKVDYHDIVLAIIQPAQASDTEV